MMNDVKSMKIEALSLIYNNMSETKPLFVCRDNNDNFFNADRICPH